MERAEALAKPCQEFRVETLYAFGSRAKEAKGWVEGKVEVLPSGPSDVDIGMKEKPGIHFSLRDKVELAIVLEDFFGYRADEYELYIPAGQATWYLWKGRRSPLS